MTHRRKIMALALLFLSLGAPCFGRSKLRLSNFKLGAIRYTPKVTESTAFIDLGWTPILDLQPIGLRGELSFTGSRNAAKERFYVSNYEAYVMLTLASVFVVEAGGGMQTWHGGNGGTAPVATGGIMFRIGELIDRLYINFSYVFMNGNPARVYKSGLAFNF